MSQRIEAARRLALIVGYMDACPRYDFPPDAFLLVGTLNRARPLLEAAGGVGLKSLPLVGSWSAPEGGDEEEEAGGEVELYGAYIYGLHRAMTHKPQEWEKLVDAALAAAPEHRLEGMLLGSGKLVQDGSAELTAFSLEAASFVEELLKPRGFEVEMEEATLPLPAELEVEVEAGGFAAYGVDEVETWTLRIPSLREVARALGILGLKAEEEAAA
jgi:hypothetical protein